MSSFTWDYIDIYGLDDAHELNNMILSIPNCPLLTQVTKWKLLYVHMLALCNLSQSDKQTNDLGPIGANLGLPTSVGPVRSTPPSSARRAG